MIKLIVYDTITLSIVKNLNSSRRKETIILDLTVGQKVVHPTHGIGKITDVTKLSILDNFTHYYVVEFFTKKLTSHVPVKKTEDIGLRLAMSREKVAQVFGTLRAAPQGLPEHFKLRKKVIADLMQSGRPAKLAQVVRELTWRKTSGQLSASDSQMLAAGRGMLIEEIALVTDCEAVDARQKIELALKHAIEAGQAAEA